MFRFGSVELLFGLLLVPLLALLLWHGARARTRALDRFGDSELVQRLAASVHRRNRTLRTLFFVGSVGLLLTALARPQFGTRVETVRREGKDVVVALDLSRSMLAEDIAPNRLQRAKLEILRLLDRLEGDRVGLVAFAGQAFVQSPLTTDYAATQLFLSAMDVDLVPVQGTNLGEAMNVGLDLFDEEVREFRVLLIVTDGEDHEGEVAEAIRRASDSAVRVFTVGIGSPDGVPIPEFDDCGQQAGLPAGRRRQRRDHAPGRGYLAPDRRRDGGRLLPEHSAERRTRRPHRRDERRGHARDRCPRDRAVRGAIPALPGSGSSSCC